ncbi:hypothetical protein ACFW42_13300 [Streptomyces albidoflavus]
MGEQREVLRLLLHRAGDQFGATPLWLIVLAVGFAQMIRRHEHQHK